MSTYKHGSLKLSHENANLNVPSIQWLGVQSRDVLAGSGHGEYSSLLRLSARDRKKAADMLERNEVLQEGGTEEEWRRELQVMLMLNVKAEMEVLAEREGGVKGWVEEKLLESSIDLHADEDLLDAHDLADMVLEQEEEEEYSPGLQADDDFLLDTYETPDMPAEGGSSPSLQADDDVLDIYEMADLSPALESWPSLEWDEEL